MAKDFLNGKNVVFLLYSIMIVAAGKRVQKMDGGDTDKKIILARCTSRCLTLHITQLSATFTNLQNDDILTWCGNKRRCSQCMQPCMREWDVMSKQCHRKCEKRHECIASCEFLKSLQVMKQGHCPPPHRASGFAAACVLSCSADTDCPGSKKCCTNGCGLTCQTPVNMFKGVPLRPHTEFTFNEYLNRTMKIMWKSKFNITAEPVLYILQRRWNYGIQPNEDQSTHWQTITVATFSLTQTSSWEPSLHIVRSTSTEYNGSCAAINDGFSACNGIVQTVLWLPVVLLKYMSLLVGDPQSAFSHGVLRLLFEKLNMGQSDTLKLFTKTAAHHFILMDIRPGRWYQFRVAAVNMHGTQGFTVPGKHIHSTRDPLPPTTPTGLRKFNLTFAPDGTVRVKITWHVPLENDLKIHHYRIWWNVKNKGKVRSQKKEESWILAGANTEFTLQGLLPDTDYLVKIQAVSYWGQKRMTSLRAKFIFSTAQQDVKPASEKPALNLCNIQGKSSKSCKNALQAFSFYSTDQLKIQLFWKQMADNFVEPHTYLIKWRPVTCHNNDTFSGGKAVVKGSSYIITGIQFACIYKVTVRPFTLQRPLVEEVTFVKTPKCNNMKVKGLKDARCPKQGRHRLSRSLMHRSGKLTAAFQSLNGKIKGEFHWQVLQMDPFNSIKNFLFSWAEMSQATAFYNTLTLPATQNFMIIDDLKPSTFYHVKVQIVALSASSTENAFLTPEL